MCAPVVSTHTYTHLNYNAITALCHDPEYSLVQILQQLIFRFKSVVFLRIHRYMPFLIQLFDPPNLHRISGQSDSAQVGDALGDHHLHVWNLKLTFGSWRGNQAEINMVRLGIRVLDRLMVSTYGYFFQMVAPGWWYHVLLFLSQGNVWNLTESPVTDPISTLCFILSCFSLQFTVYIRILLL